MKNLMNNDMTGKYNWMKRHRVEILGVLIITMIHLITMATNHCTFFGDNVYVGGDNQAQLLGYVSEFRRKILNGESPLYTWHAVGGIGFYTPFIWCLTNVTLLILSFFPYEYFNDVCDTLYVIHSVVLFLSIRYYLANREFGKRFSENSYEILLFAVPYALAPAYYNSALYCSYLIEYALMPFVILGLERIVLNKGWKLYFISLALLMINNFYIGAMGCIFIMLYYFTLNFDSVKGFINKSIKVLLISVPAVMISAFTAFPLLASTQNGGYGFSDYKGMGFYVSWLKIFDYSTWGKELVLAGNTTSSYWECNLYVGMLTLLFVVLYFLNAKIELKSRIKKLLLLIILLFSINGKTVNYIMHLFHYTHGNHNRQTMYLLFYIVILASESYLYYSDRIKKKNKIIVMIVALTLVILNILSFVVYREGTVINYIIGIAFILFYTLFIVLKNKFGVKVRKIMLVIVVILEVSCNLLGVISGSDPGSNIYQDESIEDIKSAFEIADIDEMKRIGFDDSYIVNNFGMVFGYNTCSGFSVTASVGYCDELWKLGIGASDQAVSERGFNSFLSSVFSKKSVFRMAADTKNGGTTYISKNDAPFRNGNSKVIENIEFIDNEECINPLVIAGNDLNIYDEYSHNNNQDRTKVDDFNNALCYSLTGVEDLIKEEEVTFCIEQCDNCEPDIEGDKLLVKQIDFESDPLSVDARGTIILSFIVPEDGEYEVYAFDNYNIGYLKKGQKAYIYTSVNGDKYDNGVAECSVIVNRLDIDKWKKAYKVLDANQVAINDFKPGFIRGIVACDKDKDVFTTIPYDSAWRIYVDGNEAAADCIGEGFLSFTVGEGSHEVILQYSPKGIKEGIIVSVVMFIVSVFMFLYYR